MPFNHLILCHLLLPPSIFPSIRVFSNESVLHIRWPKYWSFNFNICPSNEYSALISFKVDWLDLLAVQGTLKSLLQHHSSKASILRCSAFFTVQLAHPYMTIGKTIALTRRNFAGKVMFLLFNMLSRLVITFLPRSRKFYIWLIFLVSFMILKIETIKKLLKLCDSCRSLRSLLPPHTCLLFYQKDDKSNQLSSCRAYEWLSNIASYIYLHLYICVCVCVCVCMWVLRLLAYLGCYK